MKRYRITMTNGKSIDIMYRDDYNGLMLDLNNHHADQGIFSYFLTPAKVPTLVNLNNVLTIAEVSE